MRKSCPELVEHLCSSTSSGTGYSSIHVAKQLIKCPHTTGALDLDLAVIFDTSIHQLDVLQFGAVGCEACACLHVDAVCFGCR